MHVVGTREGLIEAAEAQAGSADFASGHVQLVHKGTECMCQCMYTRMCVLLRDTQEWEEEEEERERERLEVVERSMKKTKKGSNPGDIFQNQVFGKYVA